MFMPLDVQWFVYVLVGKAVVSRGDAARLIGESGEPLGLENYAQTVLDFLAQTVEPGGEDALVEQIQQLADYAVEQSESGNPPPRDVLSQESAAAVPRNFSPAPPAPVSVSAAAPAVASPAAAADPADDLPDGEASASTTIERAVADRDLSAIELAYDIGNISGYADLPDFGNVMNMSDAEVDSAMITMLCGLRQLGISDLHLSAGTPPFVRNKLNIERISDRVLSNTEARRLNFALLSAERRAKFDAEKDMSFALEYRQNRFRVSLILQKDGIAGSYRLIPREIKTLEELGYLPNDADTIRKLLDSTNGMVLVTGPSGSGKTTTLASLVNYINQNRPDHIISVEDPIEVLQFSQVGLVSQREIGKHTNSYHAALRAALREDPDVIVIGELNDLETIEKALTAAETGHLVIGTLHTGDAPNTMNRLLDAFPPAQQSQIRAMTAGSLRGIVCQRLVPSSDGNIEMIYEIMVNTLAIASLISDGKTYTLKSNIQIGKQQGMCTFDQCIIAKFNQGLIPYEAAVSYMRDDGEINDLKRAHAIAEARKLSAKQ